MKSESRVGVLLWDGDFLGHISIKVRGGLLVPHTHPTKRGDKTES